MTETLTIQVPENKKAERIDKFLARQLSEISRSQIKKIIESEGVIVEGKAVRPSYLIDPGETIEITIPAPEPFEAEPQDISLNVVYEDDYMIVIDKPAGMVVHPAKGNLKDTLVNALLHYSRSLSTSDDPFRPGIVHRLDKLTSGLLLVAKTNSVHTSLSKQFVDRTVRKMYTAIIWGRMKVKTGEISIPIGRSKRDRKKMAAVENGKPATTGYKVREEYEFASLMNLYPHTGRTHQLRVHLLEVGNPIFGDPDYGGRGKKANKLAPPMRRKAAAALEAIDRQALHASSITLMHPVNNQEITFESKLPEDMNKVLQIINGNYETKGE